MRNKIVLIFLIFFIIINIEYTFAKTDFIFDNANLLKEPEILDIILNDINNRHNIVIIIETNDEEVIGEDFYNSRYHMYNLDKIGKPEFNLLIYYNSKIEEGRVIHHKNSKISDDIIKNSIFTENVNEHFKKEDYDSMFREIISNLESNVLTEGEIDGVIIEGSIAFVDTITDALFLLKEESLVDYNLIVSNIDRIESGFPSRVYFGPLRDTFVELSQKMTIEQPLVYMASVLIHEACHAWLYNEYKKSHWWWFIYVPGDVFGEYDGESKCINAQVKTLERLNAPSFYIEHVKNAIETRYWEFGKHEQYW